MRNPIRLKNLRARFLPYFSIGLALVVMRRPVLEGFMLGGPLILVGVLLRGWGAGHLVKNDALTTSGPYAHIRHPLYLGTLFVATGFALVLGGYATLAVLAVVWPWFVFQYFPRKDLAESARLAVLHGETFVRYRAEVPALWPQLRAIRGAGEGSASRPGSEAAGWKLGRYSDNNELGTVLAIAAALLVLVLRMGWARS